MSTITSLSALEIRNKIVNGDLTAKEVLQAFLNRIEKYDPKVKAFLSVAKEGALVQAEKIDAKRKAGQTLGKLAGVPIAVKDNLCTKGHYTTAASKILEYFDPPYNATVVDKMEVEDAILLGKTNLDEFAMGSSCENSAFFSTKNPFDLTRIPGGSSGGSASAVCAKFTPIALGTDTGGSIRQPASLTGTVGMKPTYGRVSRHGLLAFASSLDQIGPISRTVADSALCLEVIGGQDSYDSTSIACPVPSYSQELSSDIKGKKIGIPEEYFGEGLNPEVATKVKSAIETLKDLGGKIIPVHLPHNPYAISAYYVICTAEASSNLARYDGVQYGLRSFQQELFYQNNQIISTKTDNVQEMITKSRTSGFGAEVRRRIILGTYLLSAGYYDAYYMKALKVRTLIRQDFAKAFAKIDILVGPTSPVTAFKLGEKIQDPLQMYLVDIYTVSASLAGLPSISLPCGYDSSNLPIGLQIIGKPFDEQTVLNVAYGYEENSKRIWPEL